MSVSGGVCMKVTYFSFTPNQTDDTDLYKGCLSVDGGRNHMSGIEYENLFVLEGLGKLRLVVCGV